MRPFQVGDRCMAVWSKNQQYYEAIVEGISEGKAAVAFVGKFYIFPAGGPIIHSIEPLSTVQTKGLIERSFGWFSLETGLP